jgi:hypothetical protein
MRSKNESRDGVLPLSRDPRGPGVFVAPAAKLFPNDRDNVAKSRPLKPHFFGSPRASNFFGHRPRSAEHSVRREIVARGDFTMCNPARVAPESACHCLMNADCNLASTSARR